MIDTGAEPNLIKEKCLLKTDSIRRDELLNIKGITDGHVRTLGSLMVELNGHSVPFHIVPDNFPIDTDGILGSEFCAGTADVLYTQNCLVWHGEAIPFFNAGPILLPPRSNSIIPVNVINSDVAEGLLERMDIAPGVLLGNAILKNNRGRATTRIINTTEEEVRITTPSVFLHAYETEEEEPPAPTLVNSGVAPGKKDGRPHDLGAAPPSNQIPPSADRESNSPVNPPREVIRINSVGVETHAEPWAERPLAQAPPSEGRLSNNPVGVTNYAEPRANGSPVPEIPSEAVIFNIKSPSQRRKEIIESLRLSHLNHEENEYVLDLVTQHSELFHLPNEKLGKTNVATHSLILTDQAPINTKQYRYPPIHKQEIQKQVNELLENDIIRASTSPYNSPLWIVPKKPDSQGNKRWRMVIDYRMLNEKTIGDAYPLPSINEILDQLGGARYFSVFDLASGFHQIGMSEGDIEKTAFSTPHGHYEFTRMPFGLKNAPATFQRLMDSVLSGLQGAEMFVYLDDIVIYANSLKDHSHKFNKLAERLRVANLKLQPDKCEFLRREVAYLGHIISEDGVKPDPNKLRAVKEFPRPKNAKNIKQFLGLAGYYRRFIQNFSKISKPLTTLLKKETRFTWSDAQETAFTRLRDALCEEPVLQYPDFTKSFIVTTDASDTAIGGILSQGEIGKDRPVAYASRLLHGAELNYSTIEKECLAIVFSVEHFRSYIYGREFTLVTDHKPLVWMHSVKDPTSRLLRWRLRLAEYEYKVVYKAGKTNVNADALSRNPAPPIQILPLHSDSSEESIFSRPLRTPTQTAPKAPTPPPNEPENVAEEDTIAPSPDEPGDDPASPLFPDASEEGIEFPPPPNESDLENEANSSESLDALLSPATESNPELSPPSSDSDEPLVDPVAVQYDGRTIISTRDKLTIRNDNLAFFTTLKGEACCTGSRELDAAERLPVLPDVTPLRAKVTSVNKKYLIALPVKSRLTERVRTEDLKEALRSLLDVAIELQLRSISISKTNLDDIHWSTINKYLIDLFSTSSTKLILCHGEVAIPTHDQRNDIIIENHSSALAGHKGVTKTYHRIRQKYYWPNMKTDIQNFISTCKDCQIRKLTRVKTRQPMTLTDTPGAAFDKIAMDIVGPLPETPSQNSYILTIQDLLTKYSLAIPLRQATAVDTAEALVQKFICRFGAPRAILTDQGTNFINSLMKGVARRFKISQVKTTAFHPQSNGSIERSHQVLVEYLKQYINKNNNWDEWLDLATFAYNTSVHEGTKFTPHELVFAKTARIPSGDANQPPLEDETYAQYLADLNTRLQSVQQTAKLNLDNAKVRSKIYYDRKVNEQQFRAGNKVYLLKEPKKGKFDNQYTGPYTILEIINNVNARININGRHKIVHFNKLKHAR